MRTAGFIWMAVAALMFPSCEKEEAAITLPPKNESVQLYSAYMGEQYLNQVYVDLETGQTKTVSNTCWDLQFESSAEGFLITMNGGKGVLIGNTGNTMIKNLNGSSVKMRWDNASGMKDSTVLGHWMNPMTKQSNDSVYVIDRGSNSRPTERAYQFQVKSVDYNKYVLRVARLDGNDAHDVEIAKNPGKLHVYYSFDNGGSMPDVEPDADQWHLCFLRYRWIYYEFTPPLLYTVCGTQINTGRIEVATDSTMDFNNILQSDVTGMTFRDVRDAIGYDWKVPDFSKPGSVTYSCRKFVNYVVRMKDNPTVLYKMRFIGFYDKSGLKGTPQFEAGLIPY